MRRSAVTGIGVVAPGGVTRDAFWERITSGQTATRNITVFDPSGFRSQIAAEAAFDGRAEMELIKHGYEDNRRILIESLPKVGLTKFLPADGAFYLYADVSDFTQDSYAFAKGMLEHAHVAATPGIDFDPVHGRSFIRFCYARSTQETVEAVARITRWLSKG